MPFVARPSCEFLLDHLADCLLDHLTIFGSAIMQIVARPSCKFLVDTIARTGVRVVAYQFASQCF
jgi:hypothetical protein